MEGSWGGRFGDGSWADGHVRGPPYPPPSPPPPLKALSSPAVSFPRGKVGRATGATFFPAQSAGGLCLKEKRPWAHTAQSLGV